jgi:hypothetical protein
MAAFLQALAPETRELRERQHREALGGQPKVTCPCGLSAPLRFLFKCLYCECYFCQECAEVHFGKTRAEYFAGRMNG